jgi:hypothetical protein
VGSGSKEKPMLKVGQSGIIAVAFLGDGATAFVQERWVAIADCDCSDVCRTVEYRVITDFGNGNTVTQDWDELGLALTDLKERAA